MNDDQPSQPLTDAELEAIRNTWDEYRASQSERHGVLEMVPADVGLLDIKLVKVFAEVDRLRAENAAPYPCGTARALGLDQDGNSNG